ncbi:hypothetical protein JVU11DRAFT_453 [Chiua virens]|nr:hypothetical protein JVU11DRAFT_453 [Chiua virens]
MPGRQDDFISKLGEANPKTVGPAVAMPWVEDVSGVIHACYPGPSCTKFAISDLVLGSVSSHDEHFSIKAVVKVANSGNVHGSCAVQLYVSLPDVGITTPGLELKGFVKAKDLAPRATQNVETSLDKYAISFWHALKNNWCAKAGVYRVLLEFSSEELPLQGTFELKKTFTWSGL